MTAKDRIVQLIRDTSSTLPADVRRAIETAARSEKLGGGASMILSTVLENCDLAAAGHTPLCQDTGTLVFYVSSVLRDKFTPEIFSEAVAEATAAGYLRRNCIDSISGVSYDNNCTKGAPLIHYLDDEAGQTPSITLLMKGGGSENMSRQYSLPDVELGVGRDIDGVRLAILDAVVRAQGYGCAPGILGVCIGGDRATGYEVAKAQLLRTLDAEGESPDPVLRKLERRIVNDAAELGIGPMGLGGHTTLLGARIAARPRVPASFFVTVAYMCWACRRGRLEIKV